VRINSFSTMEETNMLHCKWLSLWTQLQNTTSPVPLKPITCTDSPAQTVVSSMLGMETPQQKCPKYTRSKTGCMTCHRKKVKVCILPSHSDTCLINSDGWQCDERKPIDVPIPSTRFIFFPINLIILTTPESRPSWLIITLVHSNRPVYPK
jgi:hypothetical protein